MFSFKGPREREREREGCLGLPRAGVLLCNIRDLQVFYGLRHGKDSIDLVLKDFVSKCIQSVYKGPWSMLGEKNSLQICC